jgi:hypothetical protein
LKAAGKNLTPDTFLKGLRKEKAFNDGGLSARPVDLSLGMIGNTKYAQAGTGGCMFAEVVQGTKYVPLSTKAYCN